MTCAKYWIRLVSGTIAEMTFTGQSKSVATILISNSRTASSQWLLSGTWTTTDHSSPTSSLLCCRLHFPPSSSQTNWLWWRKVRRLQGHCTERRESTQWEWGGIPTASSRL